MSYTEKRIRLRASLDTKRLLVAIPPEFHSEPISQLLPFLAKKFNVERICSIRTQDNYCIDVRDRVDSILGEDDSVILVDYQIWLKEQLALCTTVWKQLSKSDFEGGLEPFVKVGISTDKRLFVAVGSGKSVRSLEMFESDEMRELSKSGRRLITRYQEENDNHNNNEKSNNKKSVCFAQAEFLIDETGTVTHIEISAKSGTDLREEIQRIKILIKGSAITLPSPFLETIQSSFISTRGRHYDLPLPISTGPEFPKEFPPLYTPPVDAKSSGSVSAIVLTQKSAVEVRTIYLRKEEVWANVFTVEVEMLNQNTDPSIFTKLEAEYRADSEGGKWISCIPERISNQYNYDGEKSFKFQANEPELFSLSAIIPLAANVKKSDSSNRIHPSLPNPMRIRWTLHQLHSHILCFEVEAAHNAQLNFRDADENLEYNNSSKDKIRLGYMQVDDPTTESRRYADFYRDIEAGRWGMAWRFYSNLASSQTMYEEGWDKLAYHASLNKQERVKMEDWSRSDEESGHSIETHALVDLSIRSVYAIQVNIKTNTSQSTQTFKLWED